MYYLNKECYKPPKQYLNQHFNSVISLFISNCGGSWFKIKSCKASGIFIEVRWFSVRYFDLKHIFRILVEKIPPLWSKLAHWRARSSRRDAVLTNQSTRSFETKLFHDLNELLMWQRIENDEDNLLWIIFTFNIRFLF